MLNRAGAIEIAGEIQCPIEVVLDALNQCRLRVGVEDNSSPYEVLGQLALLMVDEMEVRRDGHVVEEALPLLDQMAESTDDEVINLLITGVFEVPGDSAVASEGVPRSLSAKASALFERVLRGWDG